MAIVIKPKRSETADSAPGTSDIVDGEIAVNIADKKIYIRHSDDTIVTLSDGANLTSGSTSTIDATTDIILDADGGDIFFKDGGTTFGSATNTSGNLIVKSGTTTALTFSGANVTAAGTYNGGGTMTTGGNIVIPDAGNIGSASDTDAIAIASDGVVTFSQNPVGTLATAAQTNITSLGTLTALTVDDVNINGKVITMTGSSSDTAVFTAGTNGTLSIVTTDAAAAAANIQITADGTAELAGTTVTLDSSGGITLDADGGTITFADAGSSLGTITSDGYTGNVVGNVTGNVTGNTSGTAATVTGAAQTNITSLGTLTALTVDDVAINGKVMTMTGSSSDTAVFTVGTNGTLSIVTTDAAAAAANITITADGTFEADGTTVTLDSAGDVVLDAGGGDVFFKAGGTTFGSATNTSGNLIIKSGTTTAATFSGANVTLAGTVGSGAITSTGVVTGTGFTIGSAAINETELEIIDGATVTTTELNLLDGGTAVGDSITIADADGFIVNDNGTMKSIPASDVKTYAGGNPAADDIATGDGAVTITTSSGNITIDAAANNSDIIFKGTDATSDITMLTLDGSEAGAATFNSAITGGGLLTTGGNIVIPNAGNIGSAGDTDAIAIASNGVVTFSQVPLLPNDTVATADIQDDAVTVAKLAGAAKNLTEDAFTGNGSTTAYTLSVAPPTTQSILVTLDGIVQPIANYSLSTTTLTMSTAPPNGVALRVLHLGVGTANVPVDDSVTGAKIADDAIDSEHYTDGSIDTAHIGDDQVTYAKMQHTSTANRVLGAASAGAIGEVQVATAMIAADAVNGDKLADDACNSEHYTDGSIDTAHIADNQVTVGKLADIARGSIVYGNASAATAELTKGSANTVLTSDGTDISWAAGGGDLVFLVENDVTGGVHLSTAFSSTYITSTYERYLITFQDLDFNNDNVTFYAQVSTDNGSNYKTSGYRTAGYYNEYNGSATNQAADNTASYLMAATSVGNAATESLSGHMWLINPANTSTFAQAYWDLVYDAEDSYTRRYIGAGNWATAGAINNIKFAPSGGVWNSGKICLYGVKNS